MIGTQNVIRDRNVIQKTLRDPKDYYTASLSFELPKCPSINVN